MSIKRCVNGFSFSFSLDSSCLSIVAQDTIVKRQWECKLKELPFVHDSKNIFSLTPIKLFEILSKEESPKDCNVMFPSGIPTENELNITILITVPFVGEVSSFIILPETSINETARLDSCISELTISSEERFTILTEKLQNALNEIKTLKDEIKELRNPKHEGVVNLKHYSGKFKLKCTAIEKLSKKTTSCRPTWDIIPYSGLTLRFKKKYNDSRLLIQGCFNRSTFHTLQINQLKWNYVFHSIEAFPLHWNRDEKHNWNVDKEPHSYNFMSEVPPCTSGMYDIILQINFNLYSIPDANLTSDYNFTVTEYFE